MPVERRALIRIQRENSDAKEICVEWVGLSIGRRPKLAAGDWPAPLLMDVPAPPASASVAIVRFPVTVRPTELDALRAAYGPKMFATGNLIRTVRIQSLRPRRPF